MSPGIDYESIEIPEDTSPEEYHYTARRAEVLQLVRKAGHPRAINQSRLAEKYGTSQSNISNDLDVLGEYVAETRSDRRHLDVDSVHERAVLGLLQAAEDDDDWRALVAAWKVEREWDDWVAERRRMEEFRTRLNNIEGLIGEHLRRQESHGTVEGELVTTSDHDSASEGDSNGVEISWDR